jgi:uncharacterized protein (DUF433 family)
VGISDNQLLDDYPTLTQEDLDAAWDYYARNMEEIDEAIRQQEEAMHSEDIPDAEKGLTMSEIRKTPGVCGGEARIRNTRIPVWLLVEYRAVGLSDAQLLESYPALTQEDLDTAWAYYARNKDEIDDVIRRQKEA